MGKKKEVSAAPVAKAKKEVSKPELFYANKDKFQRATDLVAKGEFKQVKKAYESLGGAFTVGHGYAPVK